MQQSQVPTLLNDTFSVLLLEDYDLDAALLINAIHKEHPTWTVTHVRDRAQFESELEKGSPDMVISDYNLPQYTGMEALLTIQGLGLKIPFIIVTGDLPEEIAAECIKKGVDDYVIKSAMPRLHVAINNALKKQLIQFEKERAESNLAIQEARYQGLFDNAAVAICQIDITNMVELNERKSEWRNADFEPLHSALTQMKVNEANSEILSLFSCPSVDSFNNYFENIWCPKELPAMRFLLRQLARNSEQFEDKANFFTMEGGRVYLRFNFRKIIGTEASYILTFTDLTDVQRSEKRLNMVIGNMEETVSARTEELKGLNEKMHAQAEDRERINKMLRANYLHMTESIIAAKRIQQLMLPSKQVLADAYKDVFVYLRPKDIVSGDFYWFFRKKNRCWIACVDCTGHGVPGAFMSMIGTNVLNRAVLETESGRPADMLASIDDHVVREMKQHEQDTEVSTGMDISLCAIDLDTNVLQFSGAFHQLYLKISGELQIISGDRFPLGGTFVHDEKQFTNHTIQLTEGDQVFMTTDGFQDQFGGSKNKKFMRKRFIDLIKNLDDGTMYDHEMKLKSAFQDWKGTHEQVDDILLIGFEV